MVYQNVNGVSDDYDKLKQYLCVGREPSLKLSGARSYGRRLSPQQGAGRARRTGRCRSSHHEHSVPWVWRLRALEVGVSDSSAERKGEPQG